MKPAGSQDPQTRTSDFDRAVGFCITEAAEARTLAALQYATVLDAVAGFASTPLGAAHVRALVPLRIGRDDRDGRDVVAGKHARVAAARALVTGDAPWPAHAIPDLGAAIGRLAVAGGAWTAPELRDAIGLLAASRIEAAAFRAAHAKGLDVVALAPVADALASEPALEKSLDRVVDEAGVVRDAASPDLRRIRKQLRGAESELIRLLEKLMGGLESHHRVDDGSVTMRNGRWVIPVRREGRGAVGGIVHDSSATGATVFVEPPAAVEFGNRIRELEIAEVREVDRVLREATDEVRPHAGALAGALGALVEIDSCMARARFALRYGASRARFCAPADGLSIVDGRHPLLAVKDPESVVPFTLTLAPSERTLLVSGPNTGGKTVLLKGVALLSLLAQAGVPPTVGAESVLPLYDRVFADIGDEQSIEASLSTFSGHVRNLIDIIAHATSESLVLADELGSGTDPAEGAAIGAAILETLTRRGTMTVATTHLGALKNLAHEVDGVVNASLQFDEAVLAPTYRLVKGVPGRSYGIHIARRLRMPEEILTRAEARVPESERKSAALLDDLERRQHALDDRERDADDRETSYASRAERITERERAVRDRERELEREARTASRRYVLDARKEIEAAIAAIRAADAAGVAAAATAARRAAESLLAADRDAERALDAAEAKERAVEPVGDGDVKVGDHVAVASLGGATARVIEVRGDAFVVMAGAVRTTVSRAGVQRAVRPRAEVREPVAVGGAQPESHAKPEVDLRGMRIGELDGALMHALDEAVRADLPSIRIIHGKGTGALRERVGELLGGDPRVRSHRLGAWNEGGAGVTIADLT